MEVVACNELVAAPCPALETQTIRSRTLSQCIMQGEAPCFGRDVCGGGEQHREGVSDLCSRLLFVCVCVFAGTQGIQGVKGDQGAGALRGVPDMGQVAALVGVPRVMFQSTAGV